MGHLLIQLTLFRSLRIGEIRGSVKSLKNQKNFDSRTGGIHEHIARTSIINLYVEIAEIKNHKIAFINTIFLPYISKHYVPKGTVISNF